MKKVKLVLWWTVVVISVLWLSFQSWRLARWLNWKWSYGAKVEQAVDARIESLEKRVDTLETK